MSLLANGITHGYDKQSIREPFASRFYKIKHCVSRRLHAVERNRLLVAHSLHFKLDNLALDYGLVQSELVQSISPANSTKTVNNTDLNLNISINKADSISLPKRFVMGLHGTSRDSKLWPTESWVALAELLALQDFSLVLPWGNLAEKTRAEAIAASARQVIVLPQLSIQSLAAVMHQASAAIGVDTGLAHLAVALNKPTVAIYVDTNPQLTGLYGNAHTAINLGGNLKKMHIEMPTPAQVMQNLQAVLS